MYQKLVGFGIDNHLNPWICQERNFNIYSYFLTLILFSTSFFLCCWFPKCKFQINLSRSSEFNSKICLFCYIMDLGSEFIPERGSGDAGFFSTLKNDSFFLERWCSEQIFRSFMIMFLFVNYKWSADSRNNIAEKWKVKCCFWQLSKFELIITS